MSKVKIIIIHGPQRSGKTLNENALKDLFGCDECFDLGFQDSKIVEAIGSVIIFTNQFPSRKPPKTLKKIEEAWTDAIIVPISHAKILLSDRWIEPTPLPLSERTLPN